MNTAVAGCAPATCRAKIATAAATTNATAFGRRQHRVVVVAVVAYDAAIRIVPPCYADTVAGTGGAVVAPGVAATSRRHAAAVMKILALLAGLVVERVRKGVMVLKLGIGGGTEGYVAIVAAAAAAVTFVRGLAGRHRVGVLLVGKRLGRWGWSWRRGRGKEGKSQEGKFIFFGGTVVAESIPKTSQPLPSLVSR